LQGLSKSEVYYLQQVEQVPYEAVENSYTLDDRLGRGAFADVYRATLNENADERFSVYPARMAMKIMRRSPPEEAEKREEEMFRIASEISYAKRYEEVGLQIHFLTITDDWVILAMELAGGKLPARASFDEYPLEKRIHDLVVVAGKLASIEREAVYHCDVKIENILMTSDGEPVLVDFGFAKFRGGLTAARGTPGYMAPEAWAGEHCGDTFSLGIITYFMIFEGREPIESERASQNGFKGEWMQLREDRRFQIAFQSTEKEPPGDDYLEMMTMTQKQTWVRELLRLLDKMLLPSSFRRINMHEVSTTLMELYDSMLRLGSEDLQDMLRDAVLETERKIGPATKAFDGPRNGTDPTAHGDVLQEAGHRYASV